MSSRANRKPSPRTAVAYLRVSTDEQKLGPEAQRASIETWAKREGVTVAAWHCDAGVSGGADIDARPELLAALAAVKAHRAGVLVVACRDRVARDVSIALAVERAAERIGARVVSADGIGNGDGAADKFLRTIIDGAAAYERAMIRARTKAAMRVKRERGEFTGGQAPFGQSLTAEGKLVPNRDEQRVIARVRKLRAQGHTLRSIVDELECEGFTGRTGKPLQLPQVARIVRAMVAT